MLSIMMQHEDTTEIYKNELLIVPQHNPEQESECFPTTEEPENPSTYTPLQQRMYNELLDLKELEKLNSPDNETSRKNYSQAYHCLQMADYQSIQMLAFSLASQTFAYQGLAQ